MTSDVYEVSDERKIKKVIDNNLTCYHQEADTKHLSVEQELSRAGTLYGFGHTCDNVGKVLNT